jgi:hypothetical protein
MHEHIEVDEIHVGHSTYLIETIYDNQVEFTEWHHCTDCNINFRKLSKSLILDEED